MMFRNGFRFFVVLFFCFLVINLLSTCKKPFEPPAIKANNNYLVVDGVINTGANAITAININRTRNLLDTLTTGIPELHAQVTINSANGSSYPLLDTGNTGIYASVPMTLDVNQQYNISIITSGGNKYISDFVSPINTPAIDSIYWRQPGDLSIYADTHDPSGNARFYRWQYVETWAHDAQLQTAWRLQNGLITPTDSLTQISQCWTTSPSTDILLTSTDGLGTDIIRQFPIVIIPDGDSRIEKRYSILVRQFAIAEAAYNYWLLIQKTSQRLGTFFDLQPAQLTGNIHSISNTTDAVIGYVSASSIQEQRIFIFNSNLNNWQHNGLSYSCDTLTVPVNQTDYRIYTEDHPGYTPYYFITNGPLVLASSICLDCTLLGGTNKKPSFW